ncbi:MAG: urease accessory protein UreF [Acidithiobacillus sp.]
MCITIFRLDALILGRLLQLSSASLPVGAFAYSEGLEYLVDEGRVSDQAGLRNWLRDALDFGPIRVDMIIMTRIMATTTDAAWERLYYWDAWLAASRESEELRDQGNVMARALWRLVQAMGNTIPLPKAPEQYVSAYAAVAAHWQLPVFESVYAYLHSWLSNLVTAGIKLIPLGQLQGQQLIWEFHETILRVTEFALQAGDDDLYSWTSGQSLASMGHEKQYSRLFRS